jgi:asparagine synthase (glutamine-hydrolysing)
MYLPDDCLCKVDMMSMTHSLEVRVPFLDHRVVEFVASLPFEYKMRGRVSKYILKKVMKDSLPEEITRQRKLGFSLPLNAWLREKLSPSAGEFLLSEDSEVNSFLNKEYMRWMVREHIEGRQDFGAQIYALIVLEIWLRTTTCEVDTCLAPVL